MSVSRLASLAAALAINAIVWAAFSALPVRAQAVPAVTAPAAVSAPEAAVQEIVVTARRAS